MNCDVKQDVQFAKNRKLCGGLLMLSMAAVSMPSGAMCFHLVDSAGETIYMDDRPPFDMSWPPATTPGREASRARGEHLTVNPVNCWVARDRGEGPGSAAPGAASAGGRCESESQLDSAGRRCGKRAASARPGGS